VGGIPAREPAADLAVLLALASAADGAAIPASVCAIGEVSLSGDVRRVSGLSRRLAEAARLGFATALVPAGHSGEHVGDLPSARLRTIPVATVRQAVEVATRLPGRDAPRGPLRPVPLRAGRE
jgi:DNA repair protein RadA/Sms